MQTSNKNYDHICEIMAALMGLHNYMPLALIFLNAPQMDTAPLFFRDRFACAFIGYCDCGSTRDTAPIIE